MWQLERLQSIDPEYGEIVHINNKKRLVRALEIYETTGKTPTEHFTMQKKTSSTELPLFTIYLTMGREILNSQIETRTEDMFKNGWVDEVKLLVSNQEEEGKLFPALDSIGYREIQLFLKNKMSLDKVKEEIIVKTRQYSRRQIQWFSKEKIDLMIDISRLTKNQITENILDSLHKPKGDSS